MSAWGHEVVAEALGTFIMIVMGVGVVAQKVFSSAGSAACSDSSAGSALAIHLGWGVGVYMGTMVAGGVSGAHMNPSVTLSLAVHRKLDWKKVPWYILAQLLGAFVGAAAVYATYYPALKNYGDLCCSGAPFVISDVCNTAGVWATYPQSFEGTWASLWDEAFGTAILMVGVFAIGDTDNRSQPQDRSSIGRAASVALLVIGIGVALGYNTGYAINPARDLGPRLFTAMAGWGSAVFTHSDGYWWVPVIGPCIGGVAGSVVYESFARYARRLTALAEAAALAEAEAEGSSKLLDGIVNSNSSSS